MKIIELSEARAMLKEILTASSASNDSIGTVLRLGKGIIEDTNIEGFGELEEPVRAIARASRKASHGVIVVDDTVWQDLESLYYRQVTKPLFF